MEALGISERIAHLVRTTPGAEQVYLSNAYAKVWIDQLDAHWQAVVEATKPVARLSAVVIADQYVRIMLAQYVASATVSDALHAEHLRIIEATPPMPIRVLDEVELRDATTDGLAFLVKRSHQEPPANPG